MNSRKGTIRLGLVVSDLSLIGPGIIVHSIVKNLDQSRFRAIVFSINAIPKPRRDLSIKSDLLRSGAEVIELGCRKPFDLLSPLLLWYRLRKLRISIVHTHLIRAHIFGRIAARLAKVPVIVSTVHNMDAWKTSRAIHHRLVTRIDAFTSRYTKILVTVSDAVSQYLNKTQRIPFSKCVTIYNGIDLEVFDSGVAAVSVREEWGIPPGQKIVGFIGRLDLQKGCEYLIKAAASVLNQRDNVVFLIVGDGSLKNSLKELTSQLGIEKHVFFVGFQTRIPEILNSMDVFVMPSLWEGFGLSIVEGMAMSKPVIATDVGPLPELVTHGSNGLIVPPRDPDALAQSIVLILSNPHKGQQMGAKGRERVEASFSSIVMAQAYERLYDLSMQENCGEKF